MNTEKILFRGRVQGVGFRRGVLALSKDFPAINGYVRNLPSGEVEVYAQGDPAARQRFIDAIRTRFAANIRDVERTDVPDQHYEMFKIKY